MFVPIDTHLKDHRRTKRLAKSIGCSIRETVSHLLFLWCAAADECEDGLLEGWDAADIALAADYGGDPEVFLAALEDAGWIEDGKLHAWEKHAGKMRRAQEKSNERWRKWTLKQDKRAANAPQTETKQDEREREKESEREKERLRLQTPTPPPAYEGTNLRVDSILHAKLIEEYPGIPSEDWLLRYYSKIDDKLRETPRYCKRDARGFAKSPSSIVRNWLANESFGGNRDPPQRSRPIKDEKATAEVDREMELYGGKGGPNTAT